MLIQWSTIGHWGTVLFRVISIIVRLHLGLSICFHQRSQNHHDDIANSIVIRTVTPRCLGLPTHCGF
ncbi:hypothetical protein AB3S75_020495 [Citrus x aurantiifolia]